MWINTYIYISIPAWQIYVKFEKTQDCSCFEEEEVSMSWVFGKCVVRQGVHYLDLEELTNVETSGKRIPLGGSCAGVWGDRRSWGDLRWVAEEGM